MDYVELQEVTVKQVYVNDLPGADIAFDILAEADFTVCQYSNRYGEKEEDATKWFKFSCRKRAELNLEMARYEFRDPSMLEDDEIEDILMRSDELTSCSAKSTYFSKSSNDWKSESQCRTCLFD